MEDIIKKFEGLRVLVIGDVMIDAYLIGHVDRISPEAPVPVVAVQRKDYRLGGAANVALNLQALGAKPILCSVIGTDQEGNDLIQLLENANISCSGIIQSEERKTSSKTRVMAQNHQMIRIDNEQTNLLSDYDTYVLSQRILNDLLPGVDVVLFEDYDKGVISETLIEHVVQKAAHLGKKVVVDPKHRNFMFYKNVDLFKPNLKELKEGFQVNTDPSMRDEFELAIKKLFKELQIKNILLTMSERGVMISDGNTFEYFPAHLRKIADVSGAGDSVISVASLCVALGVSNKETALLSNLAGGLVCEEVGVVPIDLNTLRREAAKL
ncbi:MAG: bifunctional ADP-heptose synthase [Bacteroidota bacterium]|nr:bifunctional ADP-heptose synthase [Bacteroidota bacterium]